MAGDGIFPGYWLPDINRGGLKVDVGVSTGVLMNPFSSFGRLLGVLCE